jgi:hypothetical protein
LCKVDALLVDALHKNSYKIIQGFEADLREYFLKTNHSGNAPGFCRWKSICVRANFFYRATKTLTLLLRITPLSKKVPKML